MQMTEYLSIGSRIGNALVSYAKYIIKMFWPTNLAGLYLRHGEWPIGAVVAAALLLIVLTGDRDRARQAQTIFHLRLVLFYRNTRPGDRYYSGRHAIDGRSIYLCADDWIIHRDSLGHRRHRRHFEDLFTSKTRTRCRLRLLHHLLPVPR